MLNQKLQQKLLQKLSPQQILLMKLLQIPSVALEQRIKQEIEENPALEELIDQEAAEEGEEEEKDEYEDGEETEDVDNKEDEFDIEDYLSDDDEIPSYKLSANNTSSDDEDRDVPFASGVTFQELLLQQLGLRPLNEKQYSIGEYIIGNLDDSGYLQRDLDSMVDDLAFTQNINATKEEINEVLDVIQDFDPPGIGARNLK